MPIASRTVPVEFGALNTKRDKKLHVPGELWLLENAVRKKSGKWQKRDGCKKLGDEIVGSTSTLSDADALGVYGNELLQYQKQSVFSYSKEADRWADKGPAVSVKVRTTDLVKNSYEQTQTDEAITGNIGLVAWEDSRGGIRCTVYDITTGTQLLSDTQAHAFATRPRCIAFNGSLFLLYISGNNLIGRKINPVNPSPLGGEVTISTAVNSTNVHLDAFAHAGFIAVAYNVQGASQIRLHKLNDSLTSLATANIGEAADGCLTIVRGPSAQIFVAWCNSTGVRGAIYTVLLTVAVAPFDIENGLTTAEVITGYELADSSGVRFFYQVNAAQSYNHYVKQAFVSSAGSVSGVALFLRSVGIATKAWQYSPDTTDRGFVGLVHESTHQSTFFVARNDGYVVAKFQPGLAGGLISRSLAATVTEREPGVFAFAELTKNSRLETVDGVNFLTFKGVSCTEIDFTDLSTFTSLEVGDNSYIAGGVVSMYDGQSVVEDNFHLFPENFSLAQSTDGSGALTTLGTYEYVVCYEWTDAKGKTHRSAPSFSVSIVLTGTNNRVTLTVPTLRLTEKRGTRTPVFVVVYRTATLGSLFFRASSTTAPTLNTTTSDTVTIVDDLADNVLTAREPLYTDSGVIENSAPPAASITVEWQNRVALLGTEDDTIFVSKILDRGAAIEFTEDFTLVVPRVGGRVTAAASLDDKLIVFKRSSIYFFFGDGPDSLGVGQWSEPQNLTGDVGCIDANSISETPVGIVFKSEKGIYLLGSDLSIQYIGAMVEDWNSETITAAVVLADQNELRFTTLSGPTLVYNYFSGEWSVFTDTAATDAVIWDSEYVYIRRRLNDTSIVVKEEPGFFQDVDRLYSQRFGLTLSFGGIASFQRIRKIALLGEYKSRHKLRISLAYDHSESFADVTEWDVASYLGESVYGEEGENYGDEVVYGGTDAPYLVRLGPERQKCTSLKMIIEDVELEGSFESFELNGLATELAMKKGIYKLPSEASV